MRAQLAGAFAAGLLGGGMTGSLVNLRNLQTDKENYLSDIGKSLNDIRSSLTEITTILSSRRFHEVTDQRHVKDQIQVKVQNQVNEQSQSILKKTLPSVCVINLQGFISATGPINIQTYREVIDEAFKIENLDAVILNVNSWGGSLIQADLVHSYVKEKSSRMKVPVISFIEDQALSSGYWLACAGQQIFACRNSLGKVHLTLYCNLMV